MQSPDISAVDTVELELTGSVSTSPSVPGTADSAGLQIRIFIFLGNKDRTEMEILANKAIAMLAFAIDSRKSVPRY